MAYDDEPEAIAIVGGAVVLATGEVRGAAPATLTDTERRLFEALAGRAGEVVSKGVLLDLVWGLPASSRSRTLFSTMQRLRNKVERDPAAPRHLLTIGRAGYAFEPLERLPVATSAHQTSTHLPLDRFVGRASLLALLGAWLLDGSRAPVLALHGAAGIGKTRLALAFADMRRADLPGGLILVDASQSADLDALLAAICAAVDLRAPVDPRLPLRIQRVLGARGRALLCLDGTDHLPNLGPLASELGGPAVRVLVLTRTPVDRGESLRVGPMARAEGVELFVERARGRWPRWTPTKAERADIARVVALFDGAPLAIELAAHAIQILTPRALADRLEAGGAAPAGGLERGIRWAWQRLGEAEQRCLTACAVFPGDFDLPAAEAVCGVPDAVDLLARLADRALLAVVDANDGRRFSLPWAVRRFAQVKLEGAHEEACRDRHARHFAATGHDAAVEALTRHGSAVTLLRELPNLLAAHRHDKGLHGAYAARAAVQVLLFLGTAPAALRLLEEVVQRRSLPAPLTVWLSRMRGEALRRLGRIEEARAALEEALALAEQGAPERRGAVLHTIGVLEQIHGDPERARWCFDLALQAHEAVGDAFRRGLTQGEIATLLLRRGQIAPSIGWFKDALATLRAVPAPFSETLYLGNLAVAQLKAEQYDAAGSSLHEALSGSRALGVNRFEVGNLSNLGLLYATTGDLDQASQFYTEALQRMREAGDEMESFVTLGNLGMVALRQGDLARSRRLLDQAWAGLTALSLPMNQATTALTQSALCLAEGDLSRAEERLAGARVAIDAADLQEVDPWWHAARGLVAAAHGDLVTAADALVQARRSAAAVSLARNSDGGRTIEALAEVLSA